MKKIIAFGASSSKNSINKQFATYAASLIKNSELEVLDLNDFEMPIYSIDKEKENGLPDLAKIFYEKLGTADCIIISFSEHNGSYTTAFKNIFDWASRVHVKVFQDKPVLLLAAAPGGRGAITVLETATIRFPFHGALIKGSFSLPNFNTNFDPEKGIVDPELNAQFLSIIASIEI